MADGPRPDLLQDGRPEKFRIPPNMAGTRRSRSGAYLTKSKNYIFFDQHDNGVYRLMYSNDLSEVTLENWYLLIGTEQTGRESSVPWSRLRDQVPLALNAFSADAECLITPPPVVR